jgi:hypothetical protein
VIEERFPRSDRTLPFDEALLSGYLDGELTQAEEQRVRIHLEDHPEARELLEEMRSMRDATRGTRFEHPEDLQWDESPRGPLSRWFRSFGWLFVVIWLVGVGAFGLWQFITSPENLLEKLLAVGAVGGFALLFLSILLDRLRDLKTDRYRRVRK